ncbi:hypothetical protein B9Z55_009060 [Caenorhabditis nigoni]|nr:hypothetical protein B9Z55_009060 [Caenorhabditis nigoni]
MKKYIPEKLINCVKLPPGYEEKQLNAEELVQAILSNSDNMLRMYGTARELVLSLKRFQNFPLSHRYFGFDPKEMYATVPMVYRNMDRVPFINKADAIYFFQCVFHKDLFQTPKSFDLFCSMQSILLKSYEERIEGICEFVTFDAEWWAGMQSRFSTIHKQYSNNSSVMSQKWDYKKTLNMFKTMLPMWKQREYGEFEKELKMFFDSKSGNFNDVHVAIRSFADLLESIISGGRGIFLSYDKETNSNCPILVQVFESHGVQFVMESELFNAINIRNPDSKRLECKEIDGKIMTMSFEKVQRKYKDRIGNIEFIRYPIQRTDHKAVPIMTPSGLHCILASDCLFEILNELN